MRCKWNVDKIYILLFLVISSLLVGCSLNTIRPLNTEASTLTVTLVLTSLPTDTLVPFPTIPSSVKRTVSPTPLPDKETAQPTATQTPKATPTPTIPSEARLNFQCLKILDGPPEIGAYKGTIVLGGFQDTPSVLLDLSTGNTKRLEQLTIDEAVSPNRKWLAYVKYHEDRLVVETANGEKSVSLNWENGLWLEGWLGNENLLVYVDDGAAFLYNPFTGEKRDLRFTFPDEAKPIGIGADYWSPVYNQWLTKVVYQSNPVANHKGRIALWDTQANRVIDYLESENFPYGGEPEWSPSGQELLIGLWKMGEGSLIQDLYRVSHIGQQTKITNLGVYYKYSGFEGYTWSPDSNQVAAWTLYGNNDFSKQQLVILNLSTFLITNYCFEGYTGYKPIWSPDSQLLVVTGYVHGEEATYLIDPHMKLAYRLAGYYKPVGWMVNSP